MKKIKFYFLFSFCCLFFVDVANAQLQVLDEKISVNSIGSLTGSTRNYAEVKLPAGTTAYIYRITVTEKGGQSPANNLLSAVQSIPVGEAQIGAAITKMAIKSSNSNAIDFYIFSRAEDVNAFMVKSDDNLSHCKYFPNRINTCQITDECMADVFWFGFRNNNVSEGLDVYIEVIAL